MSRVKGKFLDAATSDLSDVCSTSPAEGEILAWDNGASEYCPKINNLQDYAYASKATPETTSSTTYVDYLTLSPGTITAPGTNAFRTSFGFAWSINKNNRTAFVRLYEDTIGAIGFEFRQTVGTAIATDQLYVSMPFFPTNLSGSPTFRVQYRVDNGSGGTLLKLYCATIEVGRVE